MAHEKFMDTVDKKIQELFSFLHDSIADLINAAYLEGQKDAEAD